MNLHNDLDSFKALLQIISDKSNIRIDILEKDYYVTLMLFELSQKQPDLPAYFKGGTALYKALGLLNRFSEDIDLTVDVTEMTNSQQKRSLEKAANSYVSLPRTTDKSLEENKKGSITSIYKYKPVSDFDYQDQLQRFSNVKIEATSFTISEPHEAIIIAPILYDLASEEQKNILKSEYNVGKFSVETIKVERIFIDKIFACEYYYTRELFDVAKHLYDLTVLIQTSKIKQLILDSKELNKLIEYKRQEEKYRIGSDLAERKFKDFIFANSIENNEELKNKFDKMQNIYVFNQNDMLKFEDAVVAIKEIFKILNEHCS